MESKRKQNVKAPNVLANELTGSTVGIIFCKNGVIRLKKDKPKKKKI